MELRDLELGALDLALGRLRRLPEAAVARMETSLRSKGQLSPITAATDGDRLVVIDGFIRILASRRIGLKRLAVEVVEVTTTQMKAQIYLRNRERVDTTSGWGFGDPCDPGVLWVVVGGIWSVGSGELSWPGPKRVRGGSTATGWLATGSGSVRRSIGAVWDVLRWLRVQVGAWAPGGARGVAWLGNGMSVHSRRRRPALRWRCLPDDLLRGRDLRRRSLGGLR